MERWYRRGNTLRARAEPLHDTAMKRKLRLAVIALVVLLLGGVAALVGRTVWQQRKPALLPGMLDLIPGVSQHIRDFRRVKVKDGRKVWEVAASDGQYFEEEKTVVVRGAVVEWYLQDGRTVGLRGDEGRIMIDGREVVRVELNGGIRVSLADYTVEADNAVYDNATQVISAPGSVAITGGALSLHGDGLTVDVEAQRLRILRNVSMQIRPGVDGNDAPA
jgi:LPS export ABC transporter protein LptC